MSTACYQIHADVKVPVFHELKIKVDKRRLTRGIGFHSGSEKW